MLVTNLFSYVDGALAEQIVGHKPDCLKFVAYLSAAVRAGHLCVEVTDTPSPHPSVLVDEGEITEDDIADIIYGANHLPENLVTVNPSDNPLTPICRIDNRFYMQKYYCIESDIINGLNKILSHTPKLSLVAESNSQLQPEQQRAIDQACSNSFLMISGGPGTGKTYTAGQLIKAVVENNDCKVALAAPTGKAAANLQSSLNHALGKETALQAKTLHSLLQIRKRGAPSHLLNADIVVVDESSMIDAKMMTYLFRAIKPGARLILLGDRHQLPPVEVGGIFSDLMLSLPSHCSVELTKCLRAELQGIIDLAKSINEGDADAVIELMNQGNDGISRMTNEGHGTRLEQEKIVQQVLPFYRSGSFENFRMLSPLRYGPFGVETLNTLVHQAIYSTVLFGEEYRVPIMLTANDYHLDLFNGETGILVRKKNRENHFLEGDYALFPERSGQGMRKISALLLPRFEYAYCLSVHKSQGSEFDHVLLLLPEGAERFGREVFYTGVTRARKKIQIWSREEVLKKTVSQPSVRLSGIQHFY